MSYYETVRFPKLLHGMTAVWWVLERFVDAMIWYQDCFPTSLGLEKDFSFETIAAKKLPNDTLNEKRKQIEKKVGFFMQQKWKHPTPSASAPVGLDSPVSNEKAGQVSRLFPSLLLSSCLGGFIFQERNSTFFSQ